MFEEKWEIKNIDFDMELPRQTISYVKKQCEEKEFNLAVFNFIVMPQVFFSFYKIHL